MIGENDSREKIPQVRLQDLDSNQIFCSEFLFYLRAFSFREKRRKERQASITFWKTKSLKSFAANFVKASKLGLALRSSSRDGQAKRTNLGFSCSDHPISAPDEF